MRRMASALALLSVLGCGGTTPANKPTSSSSSHAAAKSADGSKKKFDFDEEMKKEAANLHPFPINAPDGSFSATVSGVAAPKVFASGKDAYTVGVDLASRSPIDCAVFHRRVDVASTAWNLAVKPVEKLPTHEVLGTDIAMDDDRPVVTLNMFGLDAEKAAYVVKVTVVPLYDWTVACRHEEIGYAATTKAVATELARTLKPARPARAARYHEVAMIRLGDRLAGFNERFVHDNEAGDRTFETEFGLTLVGGPEGEVVADDDISLTEVDNEGLIRSLTKASGSPQKGLTTNLVLKRVKDTSYNVSGDADGGPVMGSFKSKRPLPGMALAAQAVVTNARAAKAAPLVVESWTPSRAPTAVSASTYTRATPFDPTAPVYDVKAAELSYTVAHDDKGVPTHMTSKVNGMPLELSRVFVRGNPYKK